MHETTFLIKRIQDALLPLVAWMERSGIQVREAGSGSVPDSAALHPGYDKMKPGYYFMHSPEQYPPFELITPLSGEPEHHNVDGAWERLVQRQSPPYRKLEKTAALRYRPSKELLLAINMALHTESPLLLTGEPGTGKTRAADFVAAYFGIKVYKFVVKSTSTSQDLIYEFDAVGYLHWAQAARRETAAERSVNALVKEASAVRHGFLHKRALWQAYEDERDAVVLIDEIDKAPRDFPNDLLHELDRHSFPHPFDHQHEIVPRYARAPLVIVTSNEERRLPDAFLRRCVFHRINLTPELVEDAVESMARAGGDDQRPSFPNLDEETRKIARERFWELRRVEQLDKKPSTAELLVWLSILSARREDPERLKSVRLSELPAIGALIKDADDLTKLG